MTSPYLTVEQAAEVAQCEHRTIRRAIRDRQLTALYSGRWLIDDDDLREWLRARGERRLGAANTRRRAPAPRRNASGGTGSVARLKAMDGGGQR